MKIGELVIGKKSWGYLDSICGNSCTVNAAGFGMRVHEFLGDVREAEVVEVNTGIILTKDELRTITCLAAEQDKIDRLEKYADHYMKKKPVKLLGYGLLETGEIIFTQIAARKVESFGNISIERTSTGSFLIFVDGVNCGKTWFADYSKDTAGSWKCLKADGSLLNESFHTRDAAINRLILEYPIQTAANKMKDVEIKELLRPENGEEGYPKAYEIYEGPQRLWRGVCEAMTTEENSKWRVRLSEGTTIQRQFGSRDEAVEYLLDYWKEWFHRNKVISIEEETHQERTEKLRKAANKCLTILKEKEKENADNNGDSNAGGAVGEENREGSQKGFSCLQI